MKSKAEEPVTWFVLESLSSGYCNKLPSTVWYKQQTFISHSSGDWKVEGASSLGRAAS